MKRVLLLSALVLVGCDFGRAFDDYCDATGRCDAGISVIGGGGGAATGGGAASTGGGTASTGGGTGTTGGGGSVSTGGGTGVTGGGTATTGGGAGSTGGGTGSTGGGAGAPLPGANESDGGMLLPCAMSRFQVGAGDSDPKQVGECIAQTMQNQRADGTGSDLSCMLTTTPVSDPPIGLTLYAQPWCDGAPTAAFTKSLTSTHFGEYRWFISATSMGKTVTSPQLSRTIGAHLTVDAGTSALIPGLCNPIQVVARGANEVLAPAGRDTPIFVSFSQGATTLQNCRTAQFDSGDSDVIVGVNPPVSGDVTMRVAASDLFVGGLNVTLPTCSAVNGNCSASGDCCSGSCSNSICQ